MLLIRFLAPLALLAALATADETAKTSAPPPKKTKFKALNRVFAGRIIKIKKKRVTIYYDFEDPEQLKDFEGVRPPNLLDASENRFSIRGGRLVLEGSSSIRHKMEGRGELRARFWVRCGRQANIGTIFTEPVMSQYYVLLNLFDERFYKDGMLILAACGLNEDEGAEDVSSGRVNWRDIFRANVKKKAKVGEDVMVEVSKDGFRESCRVAGVEGKGSSRRKTKNMKSYQFGLWVHNSRATFDDLTIEIELTEEFLELNDLKAEVVEDWEEVPTTGPLAGVRGVPPRIRGEIDAYAAGKGEARLVVKMVGRTGIPRKVREIAAQLLKDRNDSKVVPKVIDLLYSTDKLTRTLGIGIVKSIVGNHFGYSPGASEKNRSKAIRKLNRHLTENRRKYFG